MEDGNWKEEYKEWKLLKPSQLQLLDQGASTLSQSWLLNAMWCEWKELKESKAINPPTFKQTTKELLKDPWDE